MTISFADVALVLIVYFGVIASFRGVRTTALVTGAIFFAIVVLLISGDLAVQGMQRLGVALTASDTQAVFKMVFFVLTTVIASTVITRIVAMPRRDLSSAEKLWGLLLGLFNGFLVMAVIDRYLIEATAGTQAGISIGLPALEFSHPDPSTWQVRLIAAPLTVLSSGPMTDLWAKVPMALILLLLFLAFVFVATLYNRVSRARSR